MKRVEIWLECARIYSTMLANPRTTISVNPDEFFRRVDQMVERATGKKSSAVQGAPKRDTKGRFVQCPIKEDREIAEMADALPAPDVRVETYTYVPEATPNFGVFNNENGWSP